MATNFPPGLRGTVLTPPQTTPQPSKKLVEPKPPRTTPQALEEIGGNLVEPWWNPRGTLVESYFKSLRITPQPLRKHSGTLVEPWWNPRGTLPQGRPGPPRSLSGLRPQSFQLLGRRKKTLVQDSKVKIACLYAYVFLYVYVYAYMYVHAYVYSCVCMPRM